MRKLIISVALLLAACDDRFVPESQWEVSCRDGIGEYFFAHLHVEPSWRGEMYKLDAPAGTIYVPVASCIVSEIKPGSRSYQ